MNIKMNNEQRTAEAYTALSANRDAALKLLEDVRRDTNTNNRTFVYIRGQRVEINPSCKA